MRTNDKIANKMTENVFCVDMIIRQTDAIRFSKAKKDWPTPMASCGDCVPLLKLTFHCSEPPSGRAPGHPRDAQQSALLIYINRMQL